MRYLLIVVLVSLVIASTILSIAVYTSYMQRRDLMYSSLESIVPLISEEYTGNHKFTIVNNTINEILGIPSMKTLCHNDNLVLRASISLSLQSLMTQPNNSIPGNISCSGYIVVDDVKEYFKLDVGNIFERNYEIKPSSRIIVLISNVTSNRENIGLRYNIDVSLRVREESLKTAFMNALAYTIALVLLLITTFVISGKWLKIKSYT